MDRGMASSLPMEKLDRNNYASWSYKMHQYLLRHGYWSYVDGANDTTPKSTHRDFPAWEQSASRVLYCFASCVGEQLLSYIRDAKTPKDAWGNVKKIFAASTTTMRLQLRQELSNLRQRGCRSGLRTSGASSRKKTELLHKGVETGGCLSSTPMTVAPQCSQRDKKSSPISTYGTSG